VPRPLLIEHFVHNLAHDHATNEACTNAEHDVAPVVAPVVVPAPAVMVNHLLLLWLLDHYHVWLWLLLHNDLRPLLDVLRRLLVLRLILRLLVLRLVLWLLLVLLAIRLRLCDRLCDRLRLSHLGLRGGNLHVELLTLDESSRDLHLHHAAGGVDLDHHAALNAVWHRDAHDLHRGLRDRLCDRLRHGLAVHDGRWV